MVDGLKGMQLEIHRLIIVQLVNNKMLFVYNPLQSSDFFDQIMWVLARFLDRYVDPNLFLERSIMLIIVL